MKRIYVLSVLFLFAGFGMAAHADTVADQYDDAYTLNYTTGAPGTYYVYLTVDTSGFSYTAHTPDYIQSISLLLDPNVASNDQPTITLLSEPTGWDNLITGNAGSGQSSTGCSMSSGLFVCDYLSPGPGDPVGPGDIYNFEFEVVGQLGYTTVGSSGHTALKTGTNQDEVQAQYNYLNPNTDATESIGSEGHSDITLSAAPEPASIALLGTALLGFAGITRKRMSH